MVDVLNIGVFKLKESEKLDIENERVSGETDRGTK
jgi:hypothetical protein